MQHHFQIKSLVIILMTCFFLQSCSTGYHASRYTHLKYVKKDLPADKDASASDSKIELQEINSAPPSALESPAEGYASTRGKINAPAPDDKISMKHGTKKSATPEESVGDHKSSFANGIGQVTVVAKEKFNEIKAMSPMPITDDQDKLLLLWLILAGAAIVFGLLSPYSVAFGILSILASIAAVIFFILWIVNIAKS